MAKTLRFGDDVTEGTYLVFRRDTAHEGKTQRWTIENKGGHTLGWISWHWPWRKYAVSAGAGSIWDAKCLGEVSAFLDLLMEKRK